MLKEAVSPGTDVHPDSTFHRTVLEIQLGALKELSGILSGFIDNANFNLSGALDNIVHSLRAYSSEENLVAKVAMQTPFQGIREVLKGVNPYHLFLEGQKAKKLSFELALTQIRVIKTLFPPIFFPIQSRLLQQAENFCRTNLAFTFTFERPEWDLEIPREDIADLDFCRLTKFEAPKENPNGRSIMLVAPMSGHFPTLLRKTIQGFHDDGYTVYITDWKKPFDVPKEKGDFGVDRFTQELLHCFEEIDNYQEGGDFEVLVVCQPGPETMTAVAYAEKYNLPKPRTMSLMASPIDVSQNPTAVNEAGDKLTPEFMDMVKFIIPEGYPGAGREVYISPMQISMFMMSKPDEHLEKFTKLAFKDTKLNIEEEKELAFYTEYFAGMDLYHEFYAETNTRVFKENLWANGKIDFAGEQIDFSKTKTPLITFEGREDDICGIGQTKGANDIMTGTKLGEYHLIQANDNDVDTEGSIKRVGHYGVFAGKYFRQSVIPKLAEFYKRVDEGEKLAA